jgi:flagellar biosynthetic protein FlhB
MIDLSGINFDLQLFNEEKTEEATPRRREEVRKKGQVAKSADLNGAIVLLAVVVLLYYLRGYFTTQFAGYFTYLFDALSGEEVKHFTEENLFSLILYTVLFFFKLMAPVLAGAMVIGMAINFAQVGFLFAPEVVKPKLENINPLSGFKRMFSKRALMELIKALLKVILIGVIVYLTLKDNLENLLYLFYMEISQSFNFVANIVFDLAKNAVGAYFIIGVIDYLFQRREFKQNIMMSKQEIKEEFKQTEGDPQIKAKLREKQRQMAMHRMMESIPEATVVITNPTHIAVALQYSTASSSAPRVVAKGAGSIAERIKERAKEYKVPIVEDKPLARFLYHNVDLGKEIPAELYQAVAEILAMLYKAGRRF